MAHRIDMPSLGQTTDELLIIEWFKREGDAVKLGEPLLSVETDKAQVDVESVAAGTLLKVLHEAGETVRAGSPVAYVGAPGEAVPVAHVGVEEGRGSAPTDSATARIAAAEASPSPAPRPEPERRSPEKASGRVSALPAARRLANELGIDLTRIVGTGQDAVITVRDVERAGQAASVPADDPDLVAIPQLRQVIARRMSASAQRIPQFTLTVSVDASGARDLIRAQRACVSPAPGSRLTYTHLAVRAVATALRDFPTVNRLWVDDGPRFRQLQRSDVGLAVACDDGLRVVSIPEADQVPLAELPGLLGSAAERARSGSLLAVDRMPVAVTVSSLGMYGVEQFQALVDPDQTAILAVGTVEDRPVARDGTLGVLPMVRVSLSADHRVVDGTLAAQFLQAVKGALETPGGAR
ncbi:MAG: dihydrolipoamide acetyltransferase family protein [Candidatus Dormibacteria bacterium]|jgi:pyruvate dehydrogenase E2 component (dihydrolipoamide acetyltransferase)